MKYLKKWMWITIPVLCIALSGCSLPGLPSDGTSAPSGQTVSPSGGSEERGGSSEGPSQSDTSEGSPAAPDGSQTSPGGPGSSEASSSLPDTPPSGKTAVLYVGTRSAGFTEYTLDYDGDLTPEVLIQGIADLTGWDLTLAETVTSGRGGMSVCLANESSLYMGPPDPQKDEFHVFDGLQLAEMILDSIQKTLQMGFTGEGGDPDALDIYFYMEGEKPLELPDLGLSWPLDQPYQWKASQSGTP